MLSVCLLLPCPLSLTKFKFFKFTNNRQLSSYLMVFLEHLDDCAKHPASTHGQRDFLPHVLFFKSSKVVLQPAYIWER
jgi:hypothetical protein